MPAGSTATWRASSTASRPSSLASASAQSEAVARQRGPAAFQDRFEERAWRDAVSRLQCGAGERRVRETEAAVEHGLAGHHAALAAEAVLQLDLPQPNGT